MKIARACCLPLFGFCVAHGTSHAQQIAEGSVIGVIAETAINVTGASVNLKPDAYTDFCALSMGTAAMAEESVAFTFLVPCGEVQSLIGSQFSPRGSEMEYLRVSLDFELEQQNTGGRYRTRWEAAGIRMQEFVIVLSLIDFDGEYLSGELFSDLPLRRIDGSLPASGRTDRFTATFRARLEDTGQQRAVEEQ